MKPIEWPPKTNGMSVKELLEQKQIAADYLEHLQNTLVGKQQKVAKEELGIAAEDDDRMGGACFSRLGNACYSIRA